MNGLSAPHAAESEKKHFTSVLSWVSSVLVVLGGCAVSPLSHATPHPMATGAVPQAADVSRSPAVPPQPSVMIPEQSAQPQQLDFPNETFRAKQPAAGTSRPFHFPPVKSFRLTNGLQVYLVEQHELPIVSLDLNFDGGGTLDPPGKEGLASLCVGMLTEGTERLDKIQYSAALADVASTISSYATDDTMGISLRSLRKHLDATVAIFGETVKTPGFRQSDFARMVKNRQEAVRQAKGNPASVVRRVSGAVLYGLAHPSGAVTTEASLAALTVNDCKQLVATYFRPTSARLFVVGDITPSKIREYFGTNFGGWVGKPPMVAAPVVPRSPAGRIFFVDVPGAAQSHVSMMHFGPQRTAADYFATSLMGSVLGGSFSSRINMNLRENKGYSYGARGGFNYTKQHGTFSATASVRTDATYQTLLEIVGEVRELHGGARPVLAAELDREKQGAILALPGQFATGVQALGLYSRLTYFGLPLDYYSSFISKISAVGETQAAAAARAHLRPDDAVFLVVGDGAAGMIVREGEKDVPYMKNGVRLSLRTALVDLAASGDVGRGGFIELDSDGRVLPSVK